MYQRVLVTGAAGFAGGHLLDLLSRDRVDPVVAWHRPGGAPPRQIDGVEWRAVNMLDRAAVRAGIEQFPPTAVYHCAGAAHVGRSWQTIEATLAVNVRGTHHLLEALGEFAPDARVLLPSSAHVYAASDSALREDHDLVPASPYGLSKLAQELVGGGNRGRPPVLVARPFNHFGPRQDAWFATSAFARAVAEIETGRARPEMSVGNLDARRDLTDVRDTVRAYRLILERGTPGRPYNVCTGRAVAIRDVLDMLLARATVPIAVTIDPERLRPNDFPVVVGDSSRIRDELSWGPTIAIEQTIDDLLAFWRGRAQSV